MMISAPKTAPDFYIAGAAKAGTTAVWTWLRSHPQVFLPDIKEPGYFAFDGKSPIPENGPYDRDYTADVATDAESYSSLYSGARARLTGDVSPVYLTSHHAALGIASARPDARICILLRDPVTRAFSQYLHHRRDGLEPCSTFEAALMAEGLRMDQGWSWGHGYATNGHYLAQIERFLKAFPREQILFGSYETLQCAPDRFWNRLCDFLGLARYPVPVNERVNTTSSLTGLPARPGLLHCIRHPGPVQRVMKRCVPKPVTTAIRRRLESKSVPVPALSETTRRQLASRFLAERPSLEAVTGLDLCHWCR